MNLPNILTLARILLVPFFVLAYISPGPGTYFIAAALFSLAALDIFGLLGLSKIQLQLFHLLFLKTLETGEGGPQAGFHFSGEGLLALHHEATHFADGLRQDGLDICGVKRLAAVRQHAYGKAGALSEIGEGLQCPCSIAHDRSAPIDEEWLAFAVRNESEKNEGPFRLVEGRRAKHWRAMPAECRENTLGEPFHDRMLGPEVMQGWPSIFLMSGLA
jgi:hypothetical protein